MIEVLNRIQTTKTLRPSACPLKQWPKATFQESVEITERLVEVGEVVGIPVIDHVVVGGEKYRIFRSWI